MEEALKKRLSINGWDRTVGLFWLALALGAKTVLETGVGIGESTLNLLYAVSLTDGHVWSIDHRPCWHAHGRIRATGLIERWTFIQKNSIEYEWENGKIDLLFLDSDHSYEHVLAELKKFGPYADLVAVHDGRLDGVKQAVKEYCGRNGIYYPFDSGMILIKQW